MDSVVINDGLAQRTYTYGIGVTFSTTITFTADAFEVRTLGGELVTFDVHTGAPNGMTWVYFAFAPLADDAYLLTIRADHVWDSFGRPLDGDDDGTSGGDLASMFHALAGDLDGDRDVDSRCRAVR